MNVDAYIKFMLAEENCIYWIRYDHFFLFHDRNIEEKHMDIYLDRDIIVFIFIMLLQL